MTALLIIIFTLLTLTANVIFYKIKFTLKDNGYDVDYFFWHFPDIPNMVRLIRRTDTEFRYYLSMARHGIDTGSLTLIIEHGKVINYKIWHG